MNESKLAKGGYSKFDAYNCQPEKMINTLHVSIFEIDFYLRSTVPMDIYPL